MKNRRTRLLTEAEQLSYGELGAFHHMLDLYPKGIVSIVSDSYNFWEVLTTYVDPANPRGLYQRIIEREGKVVFRPDSGNPELVILGDPNAEEGSPAHKGALELLWERFGGTTNAQGFRVLNPQIGLIYGDGIYYDRMVRIYAGMVKKGFATTNIVFGIGGLLLQQFSRDVLGYAVKATYVEVAGEQRNIMKDPITDPGKRSHKGLVRVDLIDGVHVTRDQVSWEEEDGGLLESVFINGKIVKQYSLKEIRERLQNSVVPAGFTPSLEELLNVSLEVPKGRPQPAAQRALTVGEEVADLAARYATRPTVDTNEFLQTLLGTPLFAAAIDALVAQVMPQVHVDISLRSSGEEDLLGEVIDAGVAAVEINLDETADKEPVAAPKKEATKPVNRGGRPSKSK